jgi:thiamine biosynthesis lipoprotein
LLQVLSVAGAVHAASGGHFDPTVQPLWQALAEGHDPGKAQEKVGWQRLRFDTDRVELDGALTLNGIAQGFATDAVIKVLRRHGMGRGLVEIGEIAAQGGPWTIGIADPDHGVVLSRSLTDAAMATSSPYALRLGTHGHILHPRGHAPKWSTLCVEADSAAVADGLSTALCFMDADALAARSDHLRHVFGMRRITAITTDGDIRTF